MWAVTHGDVSNSSCRIVSTSIDDGRHQDLVQLENCHPFSLAVDEKYVYWGDWSREGIMRASRSDPNDVVRLLITPRDQGSGINGAYGIAKLNVGKMVQNPCQDKEHKNHYEDEAITNEERGEGVEDLKKTQNDSSGNVDSMELNKERVDQKTGEETILTPPNDMELKDVQHIKVGEIKHEIAQHTPTEHSGTENENNNHNNMNDDVKTFTERNKLNDFQPDSPSTKSQQQTNQVSVDTTTKTYIDETQTDSLTSLSTYGDSTTEWLVSVLIFPYVGTMLTL